MSKYPWPGTAERVEEIRRLAGNGLPASVISDEMKISRQAVYQLARRYGIALPSYHDARRAAKPPQPGLITGGVPMAFGQRATGTIAELLAAADLLARGWNPYVPLILCRGHDIIAYKESRIITVEVRTAWRQNGEIRFTRDCDYRADNPRRAPNAKREASMHFALVVTGEPVSYQPDLPI